MVYLIKFLNIMTTEEILKDIENKVKYVVPATFDSKGFKSIGQTQPPQISLENINPNKTGVYAWKMQNFEQAIEIINKIKPGIEENKFTVDKTKDLFICVEIK